jgi:hypothetical protein
MAEEQKYSLQEALRAQCALREMAGLAPETFPVAAFVGMISDEVEVLRSKGFTDDQIASAIAAHSGIRIRGEEIAAHYATPEQRHPGGE